MLRFLIFVFVQHPFLVFPPFALAEQPEQRRTAPMPSPHAYVADLAFRFGYQNSDFAKFFEENAASMPRGEDFKTNAGAFAVYPKIASWVCERITEREQGSHGEGTPTDDFKYLFHTILDREPGQDDLAKMVSTGTNREQFFANCLMLCVDPRFLFPGHGK